MPPATPAMRFPSHGTAAIFTIKVSLLRLRRGQ